MAMGDRDKVIGMAGIIHLPLNSPKKRFKALLWAQPVTLFLVASAQIPKERNRTNKTTIHPLHLLTHTRAKGGEVGVGTVANG